MKKRVIELAVLLLILAGASRSSMILLGEVWPAADPFILYRISYADRSLDLVTVSIEMYGSRDRRVSFFVADSVGRVPEPIGLIAMGVGGDTLEVLREKDRWTVVSGGRDFTVVYDLNLTVEDRYSPELMRMLTLIDADRCRIMGRDVFIVPGCVVARGVVVDVRMEPDSSPRSAWRSVDRRVLVPAIEDLPLTITVDGSYRCYDADVGGVAVTFAIAGKWDFSDRELWDLIRVIVRREMELFASSPHDSYLFICDRNPVRGNESFANFGIHFSRNMVLLLDPGLDRSDLYDSPMSIVAHEFFHNWNGDAVAAASDDFLWFTEGATVYYSYRVLLDVRVIVSDQYESVRRSIGRRYCDNPYRFDVPIASAVNSDLADRDMVNLLYDGGFLAAEALDHRLAALTEGRVRLIDVLRHLYAMRGSGACRVDDERLCAAIRTLSGHDLSSFIEALVRKPAHRLLCDGQVHP